MFPLASLLASPLLGTITGFIGSWLIKKEERALKELEFKNEQVILQLKNQQEILVAEKKLQGIIREGELAIDKEEMAAFRESQVKSSTVGEKIKNLMRSALVTYLAIVCGVLTWLIYRQIGGMNAMDSLALVALFADTVSMFFYLFSVGFSWFFGIRGSSSQKARLK